MPDLERLNSIDRQLELIVRALGAEQLRPPGLPPGIIQRADAQENQLADHEERLTTIEETAAADVAQREDRVWTIGWELVRGVVVALIGALAGAAGSVISRGAPPPGHP